MHFAKTAPKTSSDITQLSSDISKLDISQNNSSNCTVSNASNATNTPTAGTINTYRWADEMDDTDSSFNGSDTEPTPIESEGEKRGHTDYVVKLSNLTKNTTARQIKEILPRELQIHHITFDSTDNCSALVSFKDDRHMLKALQHSGKIRAPNAVSSSSSTSARGKDNYIFIDPWERPSIGRNNKGGVKTTAPVYSMTRDKFISENLHKANNERGIKHDSEASVNDTKGFDWNSNRSIKDEPKSTSNERPKLILKPRSKPLSIEIPPLLTKIDEYEPQSSTLNIIHKGSNESGESMKQTTNTQALHKKKSIDKSQEYNSDAYVENRVSKEHLKRSYDKKYKIGRFERYEKVEKLEKYEKYEKLDKYERVEKIEKHGRRERHFDKYEKIEKVENIERTSRSEKSSRSAREIKDLKGYSKEYHKDYSKDYNTEHRKDSFGYGNEYKKGSLASAYKGPAIRIVKEDFIGNNDRNDISTSVSGGKYVKKKSDFPPLNDVNGDSYVESHNPSFKAQEHKNGECESEEFKGNSKYDIESYSDDKPLRSGAEKKTSRPIRRKNPVDDTVANKVVVNAMDDRKGKNISHVIKTMRRKRQSVP
ncbi:conserved Plasmodium protein, unknown function [Babesia microti strain RI]|uniref:RRM domain-containing protein n=1 Tax=Babesia microti (strain RI) TaxID=1133968 RepID=A0A1R4AC64_BABMR|nr:conserved Plasmodium protein, unknown function [Babesia microti strain RI]SJK86609.1 conserved Plasmodium protein, unknown function [Babesia microti strain RI]|eukprot:XP_012649376.2 conserved Plasmodium protein, unknown function [Babesia microti strain RI]